MTFTSPTKARTREQRKLQTHKHKTRTSPYARLKCEWAFDRTIEAHFSNNSITKNYFVIFTKLLKNRSIHQRQISVIKPQFLFKKYPRNNDRTEARSSIRMMNDRVIRPNAWLDARTKREQVIKSTAAHTAMRNVIIIISSSSCVSERVRGVLVAAIMIDRLRLGCSRRCFCFVVIVIPLALWPIDEAAGRRGRGRRVAALDYVIAALAGLTAISTQWHEGGWRRGGGRRRWARGHAWRRWRRFNSTATCEHCTDWLDACTKYHHSTIDSIHVWRYIFGKINTRKLT